MVGLGWGGHDSGVCAPARVVRIGRRCLLSSLQRPAPGAVAFTDTHLMILHSCRPCRARAGSVFVLCALSGSCTPFASKPFQSA